MPNSSSARREKEKKKQSKKKKTAPPPLHKEDTAGNDEASVDGVPHPLSLSGKDNCIVDTSSSSLSLSSSASKTGIGTADSRNKDGSLSMLSLGAFKPASPLSLQAQPKSDTPPKANSRSLSLTKEERRPAFEATKLANSSAKHKAFDVVMVLLCGKQITRRGASIWAAACMQWIFLFPLKQMTKMTAEKTQIPQREGCK